MKEKFTSIGVKTADYKRLLAAKQKRSQAISVLVTLALDCYFTLHPLVEKKEK